MATGASIGNGRPGGAGVIAARSPAANTFGMIGHPQLWVDYDLAALVELQPERTAKTTGLHAGHPQVTGAIREQPLPWCENL